MVILFRHFTQYCVLDHIKCDSVMSALGNDYVCGSAVWLNELLMHWFYSR